MRYLILTLALLASACSMVNRTNNMVARWEHDLDPQHPVTWELKVDSAAWIPITPDHDGDLFHQYLFLPKGWKTVTIRSCTVAGACSMPAVTKITRK